MLMIHSTYHPNQARYAKEVLNNCLEAVKDLNGIKPIVNQLHCNLVVISLGL